MIRLADLNALGEAEFVDALSGIFEHSPWVAQRVAGQRPFSSRAYLHEAMCAAVAAAGTEAQLALIRAHPELAGKAAVRGELTAESTREQAGAGLSQCSPEEFARLTALNAAYQQRFGFPFVLAVRGHTRASILQAFEQRLQHDPQTERQTALAQIARIARFRLYDSVQAPAGAESIDMLEQLARYTDTPGSLSCAYLTPAHRQAAALIRDWMLAAGLEVQDDAVGNVVGRLRGEASPARTLLCGSHYDTVINAGRYDGRLGIVLPILVALQLRQQQRALPFDLEIIAFADEEGVRFKSTFLGSAALTGSFDRSWLQAQDGEGQSLEAVMLAAGLDPQGIAALQRDPASLLGYVELHIEQGPVLLEENRALGVVTAIAGSQRFSGAYIGLAGHAGTVPMNLRKDAAAAAAELLLYVEQRCGGIAGLVGTVGRLQVPQGAINVIPGRCEFSLDIRAGEDALREAAVADVLQQAEAIARRRNLQLELHEVMRARAAPCAASLQAQWAQAITRVTGEAAPRHLPSGAGHDAMKLAELTPIGMLFVRCGQGGISHHPDETLSATDAELAARAFTEFLSNFSA